MHESHRLRRSVAAHSGDGARVIANADASVLLVRSFFPAVEGEEAPDGYVKIGLNLAGGGRLRYERPSGRVESLWRAGEIIVSAADGASEFESPDVEMLGLAITPDRLKARLGEDVAATARLFAADAPRRDPVVEAVMVAMWRVGEDHGASAAFFDEGLSIIVDRLAARASATPQTQRRRPLSRRAFSAVTELIEARLETDVSVAELARAAGMDASSFTKALADTTGYTPYAYFTRRRMQRAQALLDAGASVTETALAVGYANPGKFAAAFRRFVGCAPSAWRRRGGR